MKYENEITIEVDTDFNSLKKILEENNFKEKENYDLNDIYMLKNDCSKQDNPNAVLNNCILIRNIITKDSDIKQVTYKYKEYNEKNEITKQGKVSCNVESLEDAENVLEAIGYSKMIELKDHLIVYSNETDEFVVQLVNNKHIYIEMEEYCNHINKHYNSIDEMINNLNKYNIPMKDNNYFVKKAEIELLETSDK